VKAVPINGSLADPFLFKIGLQTAEGRIKANMQVGQMFASVLCLSCVQGQLG
jgi:hypothetical protein